MVFGFFWWIACSNVSQVSSSKGIKFPNRSLERKPTCSCLRSRSSALLDARLASTRGGGRREQVDSEVSESDQRFRASPLSLPQPLPTLLLHFFILLPIFFTSSPLYGTPSLDGNKRAPRHVDFSRHETPRPKQRSSQTKTRSDASRTSFEDERERKFSARS